VKTVASDGYNAVQIGFTAKKLKNSSKAEVEHAKKGGLDNAPRVLSEVRLVDSPALKVGDVVTVAAFQEGQLVDVIGITKGKGFQGVVKRWRVGGGPAAHGSMFHRRIGSIGMRQTPGRTWKNQSMPGHMGDEQVTVQNLRIVQVRETDSALLIAGAVPGPTGSYVIVRPAIKHPVGTLGKVRTGQASVAKTGAKTAVKKK
jgi:large subunit ribosomal protein L3